VAARAAPISGIVLFDLSGRVAIVTGGNGGIGLGIARGLANAGAAVAIVGRDEAKSGSAVAELRETGADAEAFSADLLDGDAVVSVVRAVAERFGGVDVLVANAGTNTRRRPEDYTMELWDSIVDTNLGSVFACCQAVYPMMRRRGGGKIITIGSMTSIFGFSLGAPYSASKGAVVQLTKSLACAWAADAIQVNCILPGFIDTALTRESRRDVVDLEQRVIDRTPAGRWGSPDDVAGTAVFFASAASDFVTGTALAVDGGYSSFMA
jgi:2-deoxy-D-gluconate 3-dehydrogenase